MVKFDIKRTGSCLLMLCAMLLSLSAVSFAGDEYDYEEYDDSEYYSEYYYVFDNADLFSGPEEQSLEELCARYYEATGMIFAVMTSDEPNDSVMAYADDAYDMLYYDGSQSDGCLFLIDMYNRQPLLTTSGDMINALSDSFIDNVVNSDTVNDALFSGYYFSAAEFVLDSIHEHINNSLTSGEFFFGAGIGLIAAVIFYFCISSGYQLKGSQYKFDPEENSEVEIRHRSDVFLRQSVVRTPVSDSSSSGGSSSHTSSSGNSHGGGGGRSF